MQTPDINCGKISDRSFDCRALTDDICTESAFPLFAIAQVNSDDRRASGRRRGQEPTSTSATAGIAKVAKLRTTRRIDLTQAEDELVTVAYEAGKPSRKAVRPQKTIEGLPRSHSGPGDFLGDLAMAGIWRESARRGRGKEYKRETNCVFGLVQQLRNLWRCEVERPPRPSRCLWVRLSWALARHSFSAGCSATAYSDAPHAEVRSPQGEASKHAPQRGCWRPLPPLEWITGARDVRPRSFGPALEPRSASRS
ncbi:hypothetical protein ACVIGV_000139 [Rhizobium leguminosarum]